MRFMSDDFSRKNLEDLFRSIADEVGRSVDDIARFTGLDAEQARRWADGAGEWLRAPAENAAPHRAEAPRPAAETRPAGTPPSSDDPLHSAGPHPLDLPT